MVTQLQFENKAISGWPLTHVPDGILQRKCACGNHTMADGECAECAKKKGGLQRKLAIGASNDPLEQEADRVADQVMSVPAHSVVNCTSPRIQRYVGQANAGTDTAPASVDHALANSGRPLESGLRQDMEQRFGHDFSRVRVHSGATAEQSVRDVNANAYTVGHNIVFGTGRFAPGTHEGKRLIAHELTHVVQQQETPEPTHQLPGNGSYPYHQQAAQANDAVIAISSNGVGLIQRQQEHLGPAATGAPADWSARVSAARTSEQRAALVREATGVEVTDVTDRSQGDNVVTPGHLVPYSFAQPHINYDDNLQEKRSSDDNRILSINAGLTVRSGQNYYIILGSLALKANNFFQTRITLNHEFDHVRQYVSGSTLTGQNSELDAWTSTFIREFHRAYSVLVRGTACYPELTAMFEPLFQKYYPDRNVEDAQRENSVRRIVAYYNSTLRSHPVHSRVFRYWIHRILKNYSGDATRLPQRLNTDLTLGVDPMSNIVETRRIDCATVRGATFAGPPQVERPSETDTSGGGQRRLGIELRGGGSLLQGQQSAAVSLGARFSLRSDRTIIWNPLIGAYLLYLPASGDRTTHLTAAIGEVGLRVQQPVRGVYLDVRGGGYIGLELPAPRTQIEGGLTGAVGLGYRWERIELGAEARGMLGINSPDRVMILGVGSVSF